MTLVLDVKQLTTGFKLQKGAEGNIQLTEEWIRAVITRLPVGPARTTVSAALNAGTLQTVIAGVDRKTGNVIAVPVQVPNR